jgi:Flp pilus assembly protein TadD
MTTASNSSPRERLLALFQAGRLNELLQLAGSLQITPEGDPLSCQILAASLFRLGEVARAAELLDPLEASLGTNREYLSLYGATCRRLGRLDRARELLRRALELEPSAPDVRNNYANLLIDLGELEEARSILEQLLFENPGYEDARVNLNRLSFRQQTEKSTAPAPISPKLASGGNIASTQRTPAPGGATPAPCWQPADPLMLAFTEEEVQRPEKKKPAPRPDTATRLLETALPLPDAGEMGAEQLKLAARAVAQGDPNFALQLCGQSLAGLGANAGVYVNAADAYIRLQRFHEAEVCLLHALALGGPTIATYINLISLASLRGDLALAHHYLDAAAGLDPDHRQLPQVRGQIERQQQGAKQPYRFAPRWPEPQLQSATPA